MGLTHGFGPKMAIFPTDILDRRNAFLGYKNKKFKKAKNWLFSEGVNPLFWSKNGHCFNFFFFR